MSFLKSTIQTYFIRITLIAEALVLSVIHSRWLGPEGVGVIGLLILMQSFAFRFGHLGMGSSFAYFLAKKEVSVSQVIRILWSLGGVISVLTVLTFLVIWRRDFSLWNDIHPNIFYIALATVPLYFFNQQMRRILSGQLRITAMNISELFPGISRLLFAYIFIIRLRTGIKGAVLALLLSEALAFLLLFLLTNAKRAEIVQENIQRLGTGKLILRFWRYGRWNYLLMFSNFLCEELPLILLKKISLMNVPVGLFLRARGIGQHTHILVQPVSQMLFPFTAASKETVAVRRTNILCRNFMLIAAAMIGLVTLLIKPMIVILYGEEFLPAAAVFYAIAPSFIFWPLCRFIEIHIAASGKPKQVFYLGLITVLIGAPMSYFLISEYGMVGAGLSMSVINVILVFLHLLLYIKLTGTPFSEVIFPRFSDITYYKQALNSLRLKIVPFKSGRSRN
jgi:O-antigen/teichoic acid export membrane protein